ncbi:MAG: hypothetical protein ACKOXO_03635 [Cyanobium sp.]
MAGEASTRADQRLRRRRWSSAGLLLRPGTAGSQGFIAMVMLVLLTLILSSLTIVARTGSGREASAAQGRNREARDVAEAGITEIISELNKEPNRKILVSGVALASWVQGTADLNNQLVNPCTRYTSSGTAGTITTPTSKAIAFKNGWTNLVSGNGTRSYQLVSVSYSTANRTTLAAPTPSTVMTGQEKTLLKLTVEGRITDAAGNVISTSRVVKEFEVVPKCCKRSFGRNSNAATLYGEDIRFCYSGGGVTNISDAVAAVVGGIDGGTVSSSNNVLSIFDNSTPPVPVTRVLCRSDVPNPPGPNAACLDRTLSLGRISVVPSIFNVPIPPWPGAAAVPFTTLQGSDRNGLYVRVNTFTNSVERCNLNNNNSISGCTPISSCTQINGVATYVSGYYCRISEIDADRNDVVLDTSNAPMFVYMDTPTDPKSSSHEYINYKGNGIVRQVRCAAGTSGLCATPATIAEGERLSIYAYGAGTMSLNGADMAVTMNVFAPKASFSIRGGGNAPFNFIGRLWLNNIYANGSTVMQVLESAPAQLVAQGTCSAAGCTGIGTGSNSSGTPEVDWVARSVSYSSAF